MKHWENSVTEAFLSMLGKTDPDARAEIARRVLPALRLPVDDDDMQPIDGTFTSHELGGESG
jgi:hypothetical protein